MDIFRWGLYRAPPYDLPLSSSDEFAGKGTSLNPDFAQINRAMGTGMSLEQRIAERWGTKRYEEPFVFIEERERTIVGIFKADGEKAYDTIQQIIEAFLEEGIDKITITADQSEYHAVLRRGREVMQIEYFAGEESVIAYAYNTRCLTNPARWRVKELRRVWLKRQRFKKKKEESKEKIGVLVYPARENDMITMSIRHQRKEKGAYTAPKIKTNASEQTAVREIEATIVESVRTSYPNQIERSAFNNGYVIQFTISFQGYRDKLVQQSNRLASAYKTALQKGMRALFENLHVLYGKDGKIYGERKEEPILTIDEWFTEVYLNAAARQEVVAERVVEKDDPAYRALFERDKRAKRSLGEPFVTRATLLLPTKEGIDDAYQAALEKKMRMQETAKEVPMQEMTAK